MFSDTFLAEERFRVDLKLVRYCINERHYRSDKFTTACNFDLETQQFNYSLQLVPAECQLLAFHVDNRRNSISPFRFGNANTVPFGEILV